jgi:Recombinase
MRGETEHVLGDLFFGNVVEIIGFVPHRLTAKQRAAGRAVQQERARDRATDLMPTIKELQAAGCESLRDIAAGLEERSIPTARRGKWSAVQVARLLEAAAIPFDASAAIAVA